MKPHEKNLFVIAYLSVGILGLGAIGPIFLPLGNIALLLIIVGMAGFGSALYSIDRAAKTTCTQVSGSRFVLRRPYTLDDRYRDLRQAISDRIDAFQRKHPLAYFLIALVGLLAFLASVTLLIVAFDPAYDPGV